MTPRPVFAVALAALLAAPGLAQPAAQSGADAFARRDFAAAAELWRGEAAAGSAEAQFGLGTMNDLGLGMPRDAAKALRWYLEAAEAGFRDAQFNVAVMLDAGAGVPRDVAAAAVWYARAAANGHARAQYNLGLLYAAGEGTPRNPDLARHWLARAAESLPAAAERLAQLAPAAADQRGFAAPGGLVGAVVEDGDARRAELVWSAPPGPSDALFLLEVARLPAAGETSGEVGVATSTEASADVALLPAQPAGYAWRVSLIDAGAARYAASPWRALSGGGEAGTGAMPAGRVTLRVADGDAPAHRLARELADSFAGGGLWARVEPATDAADRSGVRYGFREDAALARSIAEFLPVLGAQDATLDPDLGLAPGEVLVRLVGGSGAPAPELTSSTRMQ